MLQAALGAVDLIELRRVNLAIRASVAEEVLPRIGQDTLALRIFCNALGAIRKIFTGANAMRLALYQAETARIAAVQRALLTEAKAIPSEGRALTPLEQSGVMRALQTLIENATADLVRGMARASGVPARLLPVPVPILRFAACMFGKTDAIDRLCGNLQIDSSKARNLLGWVPHMSVEEGLRRVLV